MKLPSFDYRRDIDGLRAVAVLGVLFCHAELGVPGGFIGVDVFFVISGYLITSLIIRDLERGTFSLANFWERRIRRIAPALLTVTFVTALAGWFLLLPDAFAAFGKSVTALVLLVSNMHFWREVGYFAAAADEKPLLHTWSLAVEEQFYLLVPVFLWLLSRVRRLERAFGLVLMAAAVSFAVSVYGVAHHPSATFYLLPTRAWELSVGVLLAFRPDPCPRLSQRWREVAALSGLTLILGSFFLYDEATRFPGLAAVPPVLGTALVIWSGNARERVPYANDFLACGPLVFVGLISYSLYLWHWPLFALAKHQSFHLLSAQDRALLIAVSFGLAVLSWRFVEVPFRNRRLLPARRGLYATASLAYAGLLLVGLAINQGNGFDHRLPVQARLYGRTARMDPRFEIELTPADVPQRLPAIGDDAQRAELLVWGDSHAMAVLPAIESLCVQHGTAARVAAHSSTAPVVDYFYSGQYGLQEESREFSLAVIDYVRTAGIRMVLLAANWNMYGGDPRFSPSLFKTIDSLRNAGATVYFMNVMPSFEFDVPKALVLESWRGSDLSRLALPEATYRQRNRFQDSVLKRLQARDVVVLDPAPVLQSRTNSREILPFDTGGSFYRDGGHLSTYGAMAVKPLFAPLFRSTHVGRSRDVSRPELSSGADPSSDVHSDTTSGVYRVGERGLPPMAAGTSADPACRATEDSRQPAWAGAI